MKIKLHLLTRCAVMPTRIDILSNDWANGKPITKLITWLDWLWFGIDIERIVVRKH